MVYYIKLFSLLSVLTGAVFIAISICISWRLHRAVQSSFRMKWVVLTGLMCFFLVGYFGYIVLELTEFSFPLEVLVSGIFLGGAIFVFIVINLSKATITQLRDFNISLENRVEVRTLELLKANDHMKDEILERNRAEERLQKAQDKIIKEKTKIEAANDEIRGLIKRSYSDLTVRFENKNLLKCWEFTSCDNDRCPAYQSDDLRCWQVLGTRCDEIAGGNKYIAKESCEKCQVYAHVLNDPITSIGEQFNILMDMLDYKVYQLEQERQKAEQASVSKSEFLANMSHEIRTPMNGIIGFTDLLLGMGMPAKQRHYLELIRISGHRLLEIINDILDFSKIEAGKSELNEESFELKILLDEIVKMAEVKAHEKKIEFKYSNSCDEMGQLRGDSGKIRQILLNLIDNAIKFTGKGGIIISIREESVNLETGRVLIHFSVKDTGVGIPLDRQKDIFKAFTQADGSTTRQFGGTGLGLSISAQFAHMMEGDLWVESEVDKGSTFHFSLPLNEVREDTALIKDPDNEKVDDLAEFSPKDIARMKGLNVLLADDEPINRLLGVTILEENGFHVEEAVNGEHVLTMVEENNFDVILMDIQMPVMDGYQTTQALRDKEKNTDRHMPIIALTAHAVQGDKEKCLEAGMDGYISKPFKESELMRVIRKIFVFTA